MYKNILSFLFCIMFPICTLATESVTETKCATQIFADALLNTANTVNESDYEDIIQQWVVTTFAAPDVLTAVLECPEITAIDETETIKFTPIIYKFPTGREIIINYETQPLVLKQRIQAKQKRALPTSDANPRVGAGTDIWTNTDPAWYGIIVTEHGSMDEFVGPDKNNTISIKYIHDNIDKFYPHGNSCTSRSAIAGDRNAINRAVTKTVGLAETTGEKDSNDYYVAGDINLGWIMWAEVGLDLVLTIATFGGYTAIAGATKATNASRALKNLMSSMRALHKTDSVRDWVSLTRRATQITEQINKLDKVKDAAKITDLTKDLDKIKDAAKTLEQIDDVKKYKEYATTVEKLSAYRNSLRLFRNAKRGNIAVRAARATKSALSGNKLISRAAKLGRSSSLSGRIRDWLFMSTMRNIGTVAKVGATTGILYSVLKIAGGMYDYTETSTGDYTSNVEFSPLLLLSADDIQGQENVINYGMWLMWAGDSVNAADDDAAYLQAMDFASKFHEELSEEQGNTNTPCNVDIFVVRPILRNPGTPSAEIYYLIMNDTPWTTAQ